MSATVLQFKSAGKTAPMAPKRVPKLATYDLQNAGSMIDDRGKFIEDLLRMVRVSAWGFASDWYEAFAYGVKHAEHGLKQLESDFPPEALERLKQYPNPKIPNAYDNVMSRMADRQEARYFYERCAQIYKEEMQEVEKLDQQARERAANRISQEFSGQTSGVCEALRAGDPQLWTADFAWD